MSFFEKKISFYESVLDKEGTVTTVHDFLCSKKYIKNIVNLRNIQDKVERATEKRKLPLATISGVFYPTRSKENLKEHSGFLCIDIDEKDNVHIGDMNIIKKVLSQRPEVAYVGSSVSGRGLFALILLAFPDKHELQFQKLLRDYRNLGIILDKSCGDVSRLRCISFDENPFFNINAIPYTGLYVENSSFYLKKKNFFSDSDFEKKKVQICCNIITENSIDITSDYNDWIKIGMALTSLGEDGRFFFHKVSSFHPKYKETETDRIFSKLLLQSKGKVKLNTFFFLCSDYGIKYTTLL